MKELKLVKEIEFNDVYTVCEILGSVEINTEEVEFDLTNVNVSTLKVFQNMIKNARTAKKEINSFLGGFFGMEAEEFGKLNFVQSKKALKMISEIEGFEDFFNSVKEMM